MEIKTILFLILHACACSAAHNAIAGDGSANPATPVPYSPGDPGQPRTGPPGRGFAIKRVYITQTDEPIDFNSQEIGPDSSSIPNKTSKDKVFLSYALELPKLILPKVTDACNRTDSNPARCNRTTSIVEIYAVSEEAVLFLKGPLVTRVMPLFYIVMVLVSVPLNALALVVFSCRIRQKKPAVIYMTHLACVDLLLALLLPLKIHYQLQASDWLFGEITCRLVTAAYYCYMYCSILLMMCMSVDRLFAVVLPIASLTWRTTRNASFVCVFVWLLALAGTVPLLSMKQTFLVEDVGVTCHDALIHNNLEDKLYLYLFFILSCVYYFVPLIVTVVSYCTVISVLRSHSNRLSKSPSWMEKRRRAAIMLIAIVLEFVVCFAPTNGILLFHCVRLATGGNSGEGDTSYSVYMLAACLGSASVFLDPLLYYYGSSQCRQKISSVFWWRRTKVISPKSCTQSGSSFVSFNYTKASVKM